MLPATDSTAFLIGQTIGFLFVFFLLVIFPMLAILRMARHVGIGGSDRVLWVVVIYYAPVRSRHLFHMGADQRAETTPHGSGSGQAELGDAGRPGKKSEPYPVRSRSPNRPAAPGHSGIDYRLRNRLRPLLKNLPERERTGPVRPAATPLAGTGRGYAGE